LTALTIRGGKEGIVREVVQSRGDSLFRWKYTN